MRMPIVCSAVLAAAAASLAQAQPVISLSSPDDLSQIVLGKALTVEVDLTGLGAGDVLEFLAAEVVYDSTQFDPPTVAAGGIVPDVAGFEADEFAALAGATFDMVETTSGTDKITANGMFFTFDITATALGSGSVSVDFADALGNNAIDGASTGSDLDYTVVEFFILPGDANNDGLVTGLDLIAVQQNFGREGPPFDGTLLGDANDDNLVTGLDLIAVQQNFGKAAPMAPSTAPVPEPGVIAVFALSALCLVARRPHVDRMNRELMGGKP